MAKLKIASSLLSLLFCCAASIQYTGKSQDVSHTFSPDSGIDMSDTMQLLLAPIENALASIERVETKSTCYRMATAELIGSCVSLETSLLKDGNGIGTSSDAIMDGTKSLYSARLAICELDEAKVHVPKACRSFLPTTRTAAKSFWRSSFSNNGPGQLHEVFPEYEAVTREDLHQCLAALHDDGMAQGWQSYTANKQGSVAMCHAARAYIEKDEHIRVFKVLMTTAVPLTETMSRSTQDLDLLSAKFKVLTDNIHQASLDLNAGNARKQSEMMQLWAAVGVQVQSIHATLQQVQTAADSIQDSARDGKNAVQGAFHELTQQLSHINTGLETTSDQHEAISNQMLYYFEMGKQSIQQALWNVTQDLELVNQLSQNATAQTQLSTALLPVLLERLVKLDEMQIRFAQQVIQTGDKLEAIHDSASEANDKIKSLTGLFWLQIFHVFSFYGVVITLLSFGLWQRFLQLSVAGAAAASLGSGLIFASVATVDLDFGGLYGLLSHERMAQLGWALFLGLTILSATGAVMMAILSIWAYFYQRRTERLQMTLPTSESEK